MSFRNRAEAHLSPPVIAAWISPRSLWRLAGLDNNLNASRIQIALPKVILNLFVVIMPLDTIYLTRHGVGTLLSPQPPTRVLYPSKPTTNTTTSTV